MCAVEWVQRQFGASGPVAHDNAFGAVAVADGSGPPLIHTFSSVNVTASNLSVTMTSPLTPAHATKIGVECSYAPLLNIIVTCLVVFFFLVVLSP